VPPGSLLFNASLVGEGGSVTTGAPLNALALLGQLVPALSYLQSHVEIHSPGRSSPGTGLSLFDPEALKLQPTFLLQSGRNL